MKIRIADWHNLHDGFELEIQPGFTALVGPNGAGKTTMLRQIKAFTQENNIDIWEYSNLHDGGAMAREKYQLLGDIRMLATSAVTSEGENVSMNFAYQVKMLGKAVMQAEKERKELIVLLDAIDSGLSIDRARELRSFLDFIGNENTAKGVRVYTIMAVNHFELAKQPADCVNVRSGEHLIFSAYSDYAEFICSFNEKAWKKPLTYD